MKNKILAAITAVLGLLAAIGPRTLFPVCSAAEMKMKCYYAANAEVAVGIIAAIVGIAIILIDKNKIRISLSAVQAILGLVIILIPTAIIGVCGSPMMHCVSTTKPALIVIGALDITVSVILALLIARDISIEKKTR